MSGIFNGKLISDSSVGEVKLSADVVEKLNSPGEEWTTRFYYVDQNDLAGTENHNALLRFNIANIEYELLIGGSIHIKLSYECLVSLLGKKIFMYGYTPNSGGAGIGYLQRRLEEVTQSMIDSSEDGSLLIGYSYPDSTSTIIIGVENEVLTECNMSFMYDRDEINQNRNPRTLIMIKYKSSPGCAFDKIEV